MSPTQQVFDYAKKVDDKFGHYDSITRLDRPLLSEVTGDFGENELSDKIQDAPYKTHQGKTYTKEEWEAFEKEQWYKKNNKSNDFL